MEDRVQNRLNAAGICGGLHMAGRYAAEINLRQRPECGGRAGAVHTAESDCRSRFCVLHAVR